VARNWDSAQFVVDDVMTGRPAADVWGEPAVVVAAVVGGAVSPDEPGDDGAVDEGTDNAAPDEQAVRPKTLTASSAIAVLIFFMVLSLRRFG
jgi:hypothetical protein